MDRIYQYNNNKEFVTSYRSIAEAANQHNVDESTIRKCMKRNGVFRNEHYFSKNGQSKLSELPKILFFDIETSPSLGYIFGVWNQNIGMNQIALDWTILTWAAKWLGDDEMITERQDNHHNITNPYELDDFEVVEKLWYLLDEADIIVAHNLKKFDKKKANSRFLFHGFPPPSPYKEIDTLTIAKREFGETYNKLDYLAQRLGVGQKIKTDMDLWIDCMHGKEVAWDDMMEYNEMDVTVLEKVYLKLRGWDSRHTSVSVFSSDDTMKCTKCGSDNIKPSGKRTTEVNTYELYRCDDCGGFSRSRFPIKNDNKKTLLRSV